MQQAGITPLYQATDKNLSAALSKTPGAGIWLAAQPGEDPAQYAARLAAYANRYHPSVIVPDIEFVGKGAPGSAGWNWNQAMISLFRTLAPNQKVALSVMPNQDSTVFNYGAYLNNGVNTFLPQSYGETYGTQFDPQQVIDTLIRSGVPANMIQPVLAPGQKWGGQSSYYALDDFSSFPSGGGASYYGATAAPPRTVTAQAQALKSFSPQAFAKSGITDVSDLIARQRQAAAPPPVSVPMGRPSTLRETLAATLRRRAGG